MGGTTGDDRYNYSKSGNQVNRFSGGSDGFVSFYGNPFGYEHPTTYILPRTAGGLAASEGNVAGFGDVASDMASGRGLTADLTGSGDITTANLALIVSLVSSLSGSGDITPPQLALVQSLQAALSGGGTISSSDLSLIVDMLASLAGQGNVTANAINVAILSAAITPFTTLSPENLAAQLLDNNDIETGYSLREAMKLVLAALAGKVSGGGTTTITIRDVNDGKNRITATVDSNGNRTAVSYNVSD